MDTKPTNDGPASFASKKRRIMLDIETLGTTPGSAIASIGACAFEAGRGVYDEFYRRICLKSCERLGLTIDADTVRWWLTQSDAARKELTNVDRMDMPVALAELARFTGVTEVEVWGNGSDFDCTLMEAAYRAFGHRYGCFYHGRCETNFTPWSRFGHRCYRTVKNLARDLHESGQRSTPPPQFVPPAVPHHALEDAKAQALHLLALERWLAAAKGGETTDEHG